jgi:hypothetical protein
VPATCNAYLPKFFAIFLTGLKAKELAAAASGNILPVLVSSPAASASVPNNPSPTIPATEATPPVFIA